MLCTVALQWKAVPEMTRAVAARCAETGEDFRFASLPSATMFA
jgi:hypothetical protein